MVRSRFIDALDERYAMLGCSSRRSVDTSYIAIFSIKSEHERSFIITDLILALRKFHLKWIFFFGFRSFSNTLWNSMPGRKAASIHHSRPEQCEREILFCCRAQWWVITRLVFWSTLKRSIASPTRPTRCDRTIEMAEHNFKTRRSGLVWWHLPQIVKFFYHWKV